MSFAFLISALRAAQNKSLLTRAIRTLPWILWNSLSRRTYRGQAPWECACMRCTTCGGLAALWPVQPATAALLPYDWFCVIRNWMLENLWHRQPRSFCDRKSPTSEFRIAAVRTSWCTVCRSLARTCNNTVGSWGLKTTFETGSPERQQKLKSARLQFRRIAVACGLF